MRLSAALVAIFAATASCLYEDQAGKVDWFRKNIGGVTHAAFHASGQQRLALVATSQSVVAALDLRSGELVWRQVLPPDETIKAFAQHGKVLVSVGVAGRGAFVRVWSTQGALIWDALLPGPAASADAIDASVVGASVVVAWGGVVTALDVNSGAVQWKEDFTAKGSTVGLSLVLAPTRPGHVQARLGSLIWRRTTLASPPKIVLCSRAPRAVSLTAGSLWRRPVRRSLAAPLTFAILGGPSRSTFAALFFSMTSSTCSARKGSLPLRPK